MTPVAAIRCSGSTAVGNRGFVTETFAAGAAQIARVVAQALRDQGIPLATYLV